MFQPSYLPHYHIRQSPLSSNSARSPIFSNCLIHHFYGSLVRTLFWRQNTLSRSECVSRNFEFKVVISRNVPIVIF